MKHFFYCLLAVLVLSSCSTTDVSRYAGNRPTFDLFDYFSGNTTGWGIVQDRGGRLTRQFVVDIVGTISKEGDLVLDERFVWNDGTVEKRVWTITKTGVHDYTGRAADVIGKASGSAYGNALNWKYDLLLDVDGSQWEIAFDDWMFLQPDGVLLNRAEMSKFGFRVGDITIAFRKQP